MTGSANSVQLHRVVITGTGAVSPAGYGVDALWQKLMAGVCCIGELDEALQQETGITAGGSVPGYDPLDFFSKKETRRYSCFVQFAIIAADEAMKQAGIDMEAENAERFACCFGSGIGGIGIIEDNSVIRHVKGAKRTSPLLIPTIISNMAAGNLAIRYGLRGECTNVVTACATGTHCVGEAYRAIRFGFADAALCGGTEESLSPLSIIGFGNLGAITKAEDPKKASMPFDLNRSGFVPGEGAGALVLESLEHAQARGANIIAEITGFGSTGDAYHMTSPNPSGEGATRAMLQALQEGGFTPADLGHMNAHGTSTHPNDAMESAALIGLVGEQAAAKVPVVSVKGCVGHMLGAAGAIEAIVTALSVANSVVPPTVGFDTPDPECPVLVSNKPVLDYPQKVALSNSLGFGGHNGTLAISPFSA